MKIENIQFSPEECARYNSQIIIPGFGLAGQQKLKASRVLVVAAAGVGTLGIVDFDIVDDSNLQRQLLFGVSEVGKPKVEAAKERLQNLNPYISIITYNTRLNSENAIDIIKDFDVVVDGTDNFSTRYLVNDACVLLNKPEVYASIFRFEGQVSVFNYTNTKGETGPNYRDLYPVPPAPGLVPGCAEAGVLGVLPGIIGCLQAGEVIKVITGIGETLCGRLFVFDALTAKTKTYNISRNENNPLNGKKPTMTSLPDYDQFCGMKAVEKAVKEISVDELFRWRTTGEAIQLIDVREPGEYREMNIGAELIPLATITANANRIDHNKKVVIHCKFGNRSATAIRKLEEKFGFENLYNLKGGINAYLQKISAENL